MFERAWAFVRRAGTLIFAVAIVVWAAGYFPRNRDQVEAPFRDTQQQLEQQLREAEAISPYPEHAQVGAVAGRVGRGGESDRRGLHSPELLGADRTLDRAGRPAAGLGLANRLCRHRLVSRPEKSSWGHWA